MAEVLKGQQLGLLATKRGSGSGLVPYVDRDASGNAIRGSTSSSAPSGSRVPDMTSTAGKLPGNSSKSAFQSTNPQARR